MINPNFIEGGRGTMWILHGELKKTGQDRTGQDRTGQDRTGQDWHFAQMADNNNKSNLKKAAFCRSGTALKIYEISC